MPVAFPGRRVPPGDGGWRGGAGRGGARGGRRALARRRPVRRPRHLRAGARRRLMPPKLRAMPRRRSSGAAPADRRVEHRDLYRRPLDPRSSRASTPSILDPPRAGAAEQVDGARRLSSAADCLRQLQPGDLRPRRQDAGRRRLPARLGPAGRPVPLVDPCRAGRLLQPMIPQSWRMRRPAWTVRPSRQRTRARRTTSR